ncbi:protein FAM91A1-like isoform X2 [Camellia sinensis]|uniref:protein FAM91A1-like isoform X2 n=1 Tax=Camellia sinensis TaxID=4442 RepID=UPI0010357829|nr:protein FAM91A1-like isoform X2 [Camellia sinensis]
MSLGESSETASSRSEFQGRMAQKLFPYHLAEYVCRVMRVSPFRYYCDMIFEVMKNEQPYDSIPNFSAADALRLTGIGRNEFIDIMNKCRSKKIMWKLNKSIAKELLPIQPVDFVIEPWWGVCLVNFTLEEFKRGFVSPSSFVETLRRRNGNN